MFHRSLWITALASTGGYTVMEYWYIYQRVVKSVLIELKSLGRLRETAANWSWSADLGWRCSTCNVSTICSTVKCLNTSLQPDCQACLPPAQTTWLEADGGELFISSSNFNNANAGFNIKTTNKNPGVRLKYKLLKYYTFYHSKYLHIFLIWTNKNPKLKILL